MEMKAWEREVRSERRSLTPGDDECGISPRGRLEPSGSLPGRSKCCKGGIMTHIFRALALCLAGLHAELLVLKYLAFSWAELEPSLGSW